MITCNVMGPSVIDGHYLAGLGNQLFTIATTLALAFENDDVAVFPDLKNKNWYGNYTENIFRKLYIAGDKNFIQSVHSQDGWKYEKIPYQKNLCLNGYFQSEKYFKNQRGEILETFSIPEEINNYIFNKYFNILESENTVAVHVRRGDYLTKRLRQFHYVQDVEYYKKAMNLFSDDEKYIFFSDDIEWCKQNFGSKKNVFFIEGERDVVDLYLMSMMKNNIIGNSTFSWWGAWLNRSETKRVIAPSKWYGPKNAHLEVDDLIPDEWQML